MSQDAVSISFDNIVAEHLAAERLYYKSTAFSKLDKVVAVMLLLIGLISIWAAGLRWWAVVFFPLAVLEWFNLLSIRPLMMRRWFKQNPKLTETYHLTFDPTGIHFRTRSIDSRVAWDHYTKVLEDDQLWLLVYGKQMYTVVPKRVFKSDTEQAQFRTLVSENIGAPEQQDTQAG